MKVVGIIGGLGPETTSKFYLEVVSGTQKLNKIERPLVLVYSVPLPYAIEESAVLYGKHVRKCLPFIIKAAKNLEKSGADFIVMPCNSLHIFIKELRESVKVPVLSIVEETMKFLKRRKVKRVGILATSITINQNLYRDALGEAGVEQAVPNESQQKKVGALIHRLVTDHSEPNDAKILVSIIDYFAQEGVKEVILACTDLQLLAPKHPKLKIYDTMKIFADAVVEKVLS